METPAKATLWKLDAKGTATVGEQFTVQFNPDSLKVTFANQTQPPSSKAPKDASQGTAATQFVGRGTSKLNVTLWFDVTAELPQGSAPNQTAPKDVRKLTQKVIELLQTQPTQSKQDQPVPPAVRFLWGTFQFDGVLESIDQTLEFFSPEGVPLRASLTLSMTQQSIDYQFGTAAANPGAAAASAAANRLPTNDPAGTRSMTPAPAGASLQALASAQGKFDNWQAIAEANNIENPRQLALGQLIDMNAVARPSQPVGSPSTAGTLGIGGVRFGGPR